MQTKKGTYHYKINTKKLSAVPYGDMAEGLPEVSADNMFELEKQIVAACKEASGFPEFNWMNSQVTPTAALWTACIGTAKIGGGGGGGGAAAPAAAAGGAAAAAAKAPEPEPEPEEEEEESAFDLFD